MGLDMYLYGIKTTYDEKDINDENFKPTGTWEECMYWRKANQIHSFFKIRYIKDGNPWGYYKVDRDDLEQLKLLCYIILMNKDSVEKENVAKALLPPNNFGCFFGSSEIDDWYFDQIEDTYNGLVEILSNEDYKSFFYMASW